MSLSLLVALALAPVVTTPSSLWDLWPTARFVRTAAPCLRSAELKASLETLAAAHPRTITLEEVGRSFEGRPIHLLKIGHGRRHVMSWSQMHGDEPSATPALLDVAHYLATRAEEPVPRLILDQITLLAVPMLNPDGAERYQRRNAQEIDINRDALGLSTPEGRLLKALRDRYQPVLGFNLHDQNRRTAVGDSGVLATLALLAVAGDPQGTMTPGRLRAKRIASALAAALTPFVPGGIARYDEEWSPRAFGDNLTAWGSPVVLIETGGPPPGRPLTELTRLHFVALLTALDALARDDASGHDPSVYDALARNESNGWSDVVLRGGQVVQPEAAGAYRADVGFDRRSADGFLAGCGAEPSGSRITEVGDARFLGAGETVDAAGTVVMPAFVASVRGLDARSWITPGWLEAVARLGVAVVRWHVAPADYFAASEQAAGLVAAGRPRVVPVAGDEAEAVLVLDGAARTPRGTTLAAVLDALSPGWAGRRHGRPGFAGLAAGRIAFDEPADLVQLRLGVSGTLDPGELRLERVWIDGRLAR